MLAIPAIDLRGGRCVRLYQGDYDRETVVGDDPLAMARHWQAAGARLLFLPPYSPDLNPIERVLPPYCKAPEEERPAFSFQASC